MHQKRNSQTTAHHKCRVGLLEMILKQLIIIDVVHPISIPYNITNRLSGNKLTTCTYETGWWLGTRWSTMVPKRPEKVFFERMRSRSQTSPHYAFMFFCNFGVLFTFQTHVSTYFQMYVVFLTPLIKPKRYIQLFANADTRCDLEIQYNDMLMQCIEFISDHSESLPV